MESRAARDLADATQLEPALLAAAEGQKHGLIGKHQQHVKSELQCYRGVLDSVNWEL